MDVLYCFENTLTYVDPLLANETKRIRRKESLQSLVLEYIYNHPNYRGLNFYGGTCLRVIYNLNRLSEDIDLDNSKGVELRNLGDDLLNYFHQVLSYWELYLKHQESQQGIIRITLRFPVLFELGLSPHREEILHLKVEISQHHQVVVVKHTPVIYLGRSFFALSFFIRDDDGWQDTGLPGA